MKWTLIYTKQALKDAHTMRSSGLWKKTESLLAILRENPFQYPPEYEKLSGDMSGLFSRRINIQHRLVYSVDEATHSVTVLRLWTHYA